VDCSIVIHSSERIWTFEGVIAVFAIRIMANHHLITNIVDMRATLAFPFIVLHDQALLPVGNIVPVGFSDW
jgi:hypothetical protein